MEVNEKKLFELFNFDWKLQHTSNPFLFHYTGVLALKNILETKEFWASKSDFLNDYSEIDYIKDVFSHVFSYVKENFNQEIVSFFEIIQKNLNGYFERKISGNELNSIFIISLSENPDSLVLWSNYSQVDGYNIGLDFRSLLEVINTERSVKFDYTFFGKIIYDEREQTRILYEEIMRIYSFVREQQNLNVQKLNEAIVLCLLTLETYAMFFKKPGFQQEEEYRIAFIINDRQKIKEHVGFRISNGSLIPYLPISFRNHLPLIQGIQVGPKNNSDITVSGIRYFLENTGYQNIKGNIYKSKIPLRF